MMTRRSVCALVEFSTATFACIARDYLDQVGSPIGFHFDNGIEDVFVCAATDTIAADRGEWGDVVHHLQ